ncbi:spore coat protein U domain-containing protein [Bryobacter aggregatus]|uniref:spore coat protein U domain-containing protein n=1 Tax=Bryobacter aggregatus TaxID=360054 RepID=UPI0004E237BC|nr:spore coat U domain-containing protein [Bryobacter aggregatus]
MPIRIILLLLLFASGLRGVTCTVSNTGMLFGSYNPINGSYVDSTGTVTVSCSTILALLLSYTVQLSTGSSGTYFPRQMKFGANTLNYNYYTDAARTTVWGTGTGGTGAPSYSALLILLGTVTNDYTAYGRIPAGQAAKPGVYTDTITITVNY